MSLSNISLSRVGFLSALVVAAIAGMSPAQAESNLDSPTVTRIAVKYDDLNLRSTNGAATLVSRISRAANRACGVRPMVGPGSYEKRERRATCIREAEDTAVAAVDHPTVTALYAQMRGTIAATVATR